jgi:hypothetical protein
MGCLTEPFQAVCSVGDLRRFNDLDDLIVEIARQIRYYDMQCIHSALKVTPRQKYERQESRI